VSVTETGIPRSLIHIPPKPQFRHPRDESRCIPNVQPSATGRSLRARSKSARVDTFECQVQEGALSVFILAVGRGFILIVRL
jgi:hypothetical protein